MSVLTVSIVLYQNDRAVLLAAINSVLNSSLELTMYLVDNSPTDCLRDLILHDNVVYIHVPSNPGFGAGHNIAIRKAIASGSIYHLVLNPDVYFEEDVLETIVLFMESSPDIGNLMPKVTYPDGSLQYLCKLLPTPYDWIGRRFNPFRVMVEKRNNLFELKFTGYRETMDVPYLSGCFMFLRLSSLGKIGLFDEHIFMYGEETDLCRRLISGGYRTTFYPEVSIIHHFEKGSHKSFRLTWIGIQSAFYYFNKWGWIFDKARKQINGETLKKLFALSE